MTNYTHNPTCIDEDTDASLELLDSAEFSDIRFSETYRVYVYCDADTWVPNEIYGFDGFAWTDPANNPAEIDAIADDYKIHRSNRHYWRFMEWSDTGETTIDLYIDTSPDFDEEEYLFATAPAGY